MPEKTGDHIARCRWALQLCYILLCLWPIETAAQLKTIIPLSLPEKVHHPIPEKLGDAWMKTAEAYSIYSEKELAQKVRCFQQAVPLYKLAFNREKEAGALQLLGDCHNHQGQLQLAQSELQEALATFKELKHPALQGIYDLLGNVNSQMGNYNIALKYGFMAVKTAEAVGDSSLQLCTIYNRLGITFYHLREYQQALTYFKKSLDLAKKWNDTTYILTLIPNVASAYLHLHRPTDGIHVLREMGRDYTITQDEDRVTLSAGLACCYASLSRYTEAYAHVKKLQSLSRNFSVDNYVQDIIFTAVLNYYLAVKDYENVIRYGKAYEKYCKKGAFSYELLNDYGYLFRADSARGNYPAALDYYKKYKVLQDSLYSEEKTREIAQLQMEYETERKDQELHLKEQNIRLLTHQALLQKTDLQRARLEGYVIIGGTCMLIILLVLGYNRYQLKQKINRQLKRQQEEISKQHDSLHVLLYSQRKLVAEKEWLVREIHHRVKNNLQIIIRLLGTQAAHLDDEHALAAIHESRHRMQAISLIHQKLYQSESMAIVDMDIYIRELVAYFRDSFTGSGQISFDLQIAKVYLEVYQAVPVGLILNEAITNAFKYAFSGTESGRITICFQYIAENYLLLSVKDNGKGLPADFEMKRHTSMGIILMETLSEQLEGNLSVRGKDGVNVVIIFKPQHNRDTVPGLLKFVNKTA